MKFNKKHIIGFVCLCLVFGACVDTYKIDIVTDRGYILVDGTITDLNEPQFVQIVRTPDDAQYTSTEFTSTIVARTKTAFPVSNANVKLIVNRKESIPLQEVDAGYYYLPASFKAKVGDTYQLWFQTINNGKIYESSIETMLPVAPITRIYDEFNKTGVKKYGGGNERISSNDVYIDFDEIPNMKNFYRWRWVLWETQKYCETCKQARYNLYETENGETGDCYRDLTLPGNNEYDYICGSLCWDIFYSSEINIFSDIYTDGQPQKNKLVAQIPLYQSNQCLVSIQQMSLTPNAYRYFKLIQDQSVNTGTLADTPPAPIKSNVINVKDSKELVLGYFSVSSVSEKRYMITRKTAEGGRLNGLFTTITNRLPQPEDPSGDRGDIPLAICKRSLTRTPLRPAGWEIK